MNTTRIGIDLAKTVFEVAISRTPGHVEKRKRLARGRMHEFFAQCEPAEILMEACGSAHHWGRELQAMGHRVSLLHPGRWRATGTATTPYPEALFPPLGAWRKLVPLHGRTRWDGL